MKKIYLVAFVLGIGCGKKMPVPIQSADHLSITYDTTNYIPLIPDTSAVGVTSASLRYIRFEHSTRLGYAGYAGDTTFAIYEKGKGCLIMKYVGGDTLLQTKGIRSLTYFGVDYRVSQNLLGKPLFNVFEVYRGDTTLKKVFIAASDSVQIFVAVNSYPSGSSPATITADLNSLFYQKLDTVQYQIP